MEKDELLTKLKVLFENDPPRARGGWVTGSPPVIEPIFHPERFEPAAYSPTWWTMPDRTATAVDKIRYFVDQCDYLDFCMIDSTEGETDVFLTFSCADEFQDLIIDLAPELERITEVLTVSVFDQTFDAVVLLARTRSPWMPGEWPAGEVK